MKNIRHIVKEEMENFFPNQPTVSLMAREGVGDKYAEKAFGIPDTTRQTDVRTQQQMPDPNKGELVGQILNTDMYDDWSFEFGDERPQPKPIANAFVNPKSLNDFEPSVRAVSDREGNLFVADKDEMFFHDNLMSTVRKNKKYAIPETRYIQWYRFHNSNTFDTSNSFENFFGVDFTYGLLMQYIYALINKNPQFKYRGTDDVEFEPKAVKAYQKKTFNKITENVLAKLNENTYKVYHGTNNQFDRFDFKRTTQGIVWFTDSIDSIQKGEHGGQGSKYIMTRYITINNPAGWEEYEKYGLGQLQDMGYDGVILPQGDKTDYFVFSNKSIRKRPANPVKENTEDYRGEHTAPTREDSPMYDVTNAFGDDFYDSLEKSVRYYGAYQPYDSYSVSLIQRVRNRPNAMIKIYRAVPKVLTNQEKINDYELRMKNIQRRGRLPQDAGNWRNASEYYNWLDSEVEKLKTLPAENVEKIKINSGDWVTINPAYAKEHGRDNLNNKYKVLTKTVPAKNLFTDGNSIHEWGYVA